MAALTSENRPEAKPKQLLKTLIREIYKSLYLEYLYLQDIEMFNFMINVLFLNHELIKIKLSLKYFNAGHYSKQAQPQDRGDYALKL